MKPGDDGYEHALAELMAVDYPCFLQQGNRRSVFWIDDLKISGEGEDPAQAYQALLENKRELFERHLLTGSIEDLPRPSPQVRGGGAPVGWMELCVKKTLVSTLTVLFILALIGGGLFLAGKRAMVGFEQASIGFVKSALSTLAAQSKGLGEEAKEEIHRDLKIIVEQLKPFAEDLSPLFEHRAENGEGGKEKNSR